MHEACILSNKVVTCMYVYTYRSRCTKVGGLPDLIQTVNSSSTVNVAQVVGNMDGTIKVPTYDRVIYLGEHVQKLPGIKSSPPSPFLQRPSGPHVCEGDGGLS